MVIKLVTILLGYYIKCVEVSGVMVPFTSSEGNLAFNICLPNKTLCIKWPYPEWNSIITASDRISPLYCGTRLSGYNNWGVHDGIWYLNVKEGPYKANVPHLYLPEEEK